nr:rhomboid family intramembrane serine protease [Candidatus Baldrarchaeota archaeon]
MFPIKDENPPSKFPILNMIFIVVNVAAFFSLYLFSGNYDEIIWNYGLIPNDFVSGNFERFYTLFTSMFLHGNFFHLFGNMIYLYIFGDNVEDALGTGRYLIFYLSCGIIASITHILSLTNPKEYFIPTIGASGAISGVFGAYFLLYPRARVITLVFYGWAFLTAIPAIFFLGFWFLLQWLYAVYDVGGGVAYWAHIGGFIAGLALAPIFKKRKEVEVNYGI